MQLGAVVCPLGSGRAEEGAAPGPSTTARALPDTGTPIEEYCGWRRLDVTLPVAEQAEEDEHDQIDDPRDQRGSICRRVEAVSAAVP